MIVILTTIAGDLMADNNALKGRRERRNVYTSTKEALKASLRRWGSLIASNRVQLGTAHFN